MRSDQVQFVRLTLTVVIILLAAEGLIVGTRGLSRMFVATGIR
jgi:hypothetical protein